MAALGKCWHQVGAGFTYRQQKHVRKVIHAVFVAKYRACFHDIFSLVLGPWLFFSANVRIYTNSTCCVFVLSDVRGLWKPFKAMIESPGPPLPPRAGAVSPPAAGSVVSPGNEAPAPGVSASLWGGDGPGVPGGRADSPGAAHGAAATSSSPGAAVCPSCLAPFDQARKRRLIDACGHERCYSCMFTSEVCTLCQLNGQ